MVILETSGARLLLLLGKAHESQARWKGSFVKHTGVEETRGQGYTWY